MIEQILQADRYLQVDQVEKARDVYQKVIDNDPGNAIAVVGLARCALAEGDDARAYELASRALEIDPENEMARRMEARLSEILATRGEPVRRPLAAGTPSSQEMRSVVTEGTRADEPETAAPPPPSAATTQAAPPIPTPTTSTSTTATQAKEPAVRKSFFDRLMGR